MPCPYAPGIWRIRKYLPNEQFDYSNYSSAQSKGISIEYFSLDIKTKYRMENKPSTPENEYPSKLESKVSQKDDNSDDFLFVSSFARISTALYCVSTHSILGGEKNNRIV